MSRDQLARREFLSVLGWSAAGVALGGAIEGCGGASSSVAAPPPAVGSVTGLVFDEAKTPQPLLGAIFLLYPTGQHTGIRTGVDVEGKFRFDNLPPGNWQIRFHAPGLAYVPEPIVHPIRFSVEANKDTYVPVRVDRGVEESAMHEIYVGDYFFQEQPFGKENGETVVRLGESVCWYNVGLMPHTVTGGPWGDSGRLERAQNYVWIPDRIGVFGYRCTFHGNQMFATLKVTP